MTTIENLAEAPATHVQLPTVKRRHPWRLVAATAILALIGATLAAFAQGKINWPATGSYILYKVVLEAVWYTVILAVAAQVVAIALGVLIAVMRLSPNPVASSSASLFIWFFRGVPVLLQIIIWYNLALIFERITIGIPFTDIVLFEQSTNSLMTPFLAALLGLALNEAAYMAEIVRGGIKSVDNGQLEAAAALAMSPIRTMSRIILPQAMRVIIPPTGNDFINMLKTTSLASVITYPELLRAAQNIASNNLQVMETLFAATFWYMVLVSLTSVGQYFVERRFDSGVTRKRAKTGRAILGKIINPPMRRTPTTATREES